MTDTSSWPDEEPSEGEEGKVGVSDGVEVGDGDSKGSCLRRRTGAETVVNCVVVMTCSTVDVTVEAWNCVAVAGPWVTQTGVNVEQREKGDEAKRIADRKRNLSADSEIADGQLGVLIHWPMSNMGLG
jgi:hypothetical protein